MSNDYYCKICDIPCTGKAPYEQHLVSIKHVKKAKLFGGQSSAEPAASISAVPEDSPGLSTAVSLSAETMRILLEWNHPLGYTPYCEICHLPLHGGDNADIHFRSDNRIHQQKLAAWKEIRESVPDFSCKVCSEIFSTEKLMLQHIHSESHLTSTQLKAGLEKFILVYQTYQKLKAARQNNIKEENTLENQFHQLQIIDPSETTSKAKKKAPIFDINQLTQAMRARADDDD